MKRSPDDYLKGERNFYCPCDDFDLFNQESNINRDTYCDVPMSKCVERAMDNRFRSFSPKKIINQETKSFTYEQAEKYCTEALRNNTGLSLLIDTDIYNPSFNVYACAMSLIVSQIYFI